MELSFRPACLPIAQGGLPHTSVEAAMGLLFATTPDLPAWIQLPQRGFRDHLQVQSAVGFPGLVVAPHREQMYVNRADAEGQLDTLALAYLRNETAAGSLPTDYTVVLAEFSRRLGANFGGRALKGQLIGPISLGMHLTDERERPLVYDPALLEALVQHLALRASWHVAQLQSYCNEVIICLDEPFLDALGSALCPIDWEDGIDVLQRVFTSIEGCRGIAASGDVDWMQLLQLSIEFILFDAYHHGDNLIEAADAVGAFLERGGVLAWGIVPADVAALQHETVDTLSQHFATLVDALVDAGISHNQIIQSTLISTSGSVALLPVEWAEQALRRCAELSAALRATYKLPL